jgi:hypothetical protein
LCQLCNENPDILLLKVDFDENRDIVKPLSIRVRPARLAACVPRACTQRPQGRRRAGISAPPLAPQSRV